RNNISDRNVISKNFKIVGFTRLSPQIYLWASYFGICTFIILLNCSFSIVKERFASFRYEK
ncbi:MAG: hypothetical protein JJT94_04520, partial [Bernardetiaceae bacterium]|nr:hypothetical protein [Bernardetiaceae bacterium]